MVKRNNKKLYIGISVVAVILIAIGFFLFTPTAPTSPTSSAQPNSPQSSTAYFSRDSSGNYVPSAGVTAETPAQDSNILTQPAQTTPTPEQPSISQITPSVQPKGYLTNLKISGTTFTLGTPIKVTGTFIAEAPGDYYIEAGLVQSSRQPLAITLTSSQSACDQSKNYAGAWYRGAKTGDVVNFELSFVDYGITGKYNVEGGVYSRCGVGADIASISPIQVSILAPQPAISGTDATNSNTNPPASTTPSICTPSGYFTQIWVRKLANIHDFINKDNSIPRVVGVFKNNAPCRVEYYIEAGMLESSFKPLAFIPSISGATGTPSACDGNVHFSGVKVTLNPGESIGFRLYPQNYGKDGRFALQGGVNNKNGQFCGFGANIASFPSQEVVFAGFGTTDVANSWERII